jgi:hypothetical protein
LKSDCAQFNIFVRAAGARIRKDFFIFVRFGKEVPATWSPPIGANKAADDLLRDVVNYCDEEDSTEGNSGLIKIILDE